MIACCHNVYNIMATIDKEQYVLGLAEKLKWVYCVVFFDNVYLTVMSYFKYTIFWFSVFRLCFLPVCYNSFSYFFFFNVQYFSVLDCVFFTLYWVRSIKFDSLIFLAVLFVLLDTLYCPAWFVCGKRLKKNNKKKTFIDNLFHIRFSMKNTVVNTHMMNVCSNLISIYSIFYSLKYKI